MADIDLLTAAWDDKLAKEAAFEAEARRGKPRSKDEQLQAYIDFKRAEDAFLKSTKHLDTLIYQMLQSE